MEARKATKVMHNWVSDGSSGVRIGSQPAAMAICDVPAGCCTVATSRIGRIDPVVAGGGS